MIQILFEIMRYCN